MTTWTVTLLVVHMFATFAFAKLYNQTPDRMQKFVVALLMLASLILVNAYSLQISGDNVEWLRWLAQEIEHVAVLLYVFRLAYKEHISCKNWYQPSQS